MKIFGTALSIILVLNVSLVYGAEKGMPQLNPEFWLAQIFWLTLIFSSLYLAIWKIFLPKIANNIENRKSKVANDINETQKIKENVEKKLEEYNQKIDEAKKESKKIIENNKKILESEIKKKNDKFNEEIEKELLSIEKEIRDLKKTSISSINKIAVEIASEIIKKTVGTEINMSNASAIVEDISKKKVEKFL